MKKLILITCLLIALLGMARNVVAVSGYGSNDAGEIHLIELETATSIPLFGTGIVFQGLAKDPSSETLYGSTVDGDLYSIDINSGPTFGTTTLIGNMGLGAVEAMDFNGPELWVTDSAVFPTIWSIDTSIGQTTATLSKSSVQQGSPEINDAVTAMTVNANSTKDVWLAIPKFPSMDLKSIDTDIPFSPSPPFNTTQIGPLSDGNFMGPMIMGMDMAMDSNGVLVLYGLADDGGVYSIDQASGDLTKTGDIDGQADTEWLGLAAVDTAAAATTIIELDIKPQTCPNPLNVKSNGVFLVAILGTSDFDVTTIDADSITLNGVAPDKSKSNFENVTAPSDLELCDCEIFPPDTYVDLVLKFNNQEFVASLEEVQDGDIIELTLTGNLLEDAGGTAIEGKDCVLIKDKGDDSSSYNGSSHKKKK